MTMSDDILGCHNSEVGEEGSIVSGGWRPGMLLILPGMYTY